MSPARPVVWRRTSMVEHVVVDVGVLGELGLGEHRVAHVAQRIDPRPHDIGAARGHIGEHRGLRLDGSSARGGPQCFGLGQQPSANRVETRPMCRGRATADDRPEAHVHIQGVPHQQDALRRRLAGDDLADPGGVRTHRRPSARTKTNSVTECAPRRLRDSLELVVGRASEIGLSPVRGTTWVCVVSWFSNSSRIHSV